MPPKNEVPTETTNGVAPEFVEREVLGVGTLVEPNGVGEVFYSKSPGYRVQFGEETLEFSPISLKKSKGSNHRMVGGKFYANPEQAKFLNRLMPDEFLSKEIDLAGKTE